MAETRIERSQLPPVAWFIILVLGFSVFAAIVLRIYGSFSDPDGWKDLAISLIQSCFVASLITYFNAGRGANGEVPSAIRDRAVDKSAQARQRGIPWYTAPVLWVPISMLSIIWYFPG